MASPENTYLRMGDTDLDLDESDEETRNEENMFRVYHRGLDKLKFSEVREDMEFPDKPFR
ncbi:hypothetical protein FA13DRAFT_1732516 [Coprinellus micaceus]|uniref:Uncharacterized protein n=1 Tax=Coprinellus micaceus TaxID=71717 RepID=A0A4Y7TDK8_COPMI|nr:hypothetical protein FA13DRAFT_1732516 [Coprinellus micaceus]